MLLREAIAKITWISRILFQLLKSSVSSVFSIRLTSSFLFAPSFPFWCGKVEGSRAVALLIISIRLKSFGEKILRFRFSSAVAWRFLITCTMLLNLFAVGRKLLYFGCRTISHGRVLFTENGREKNGLLTFFHACTSNFLSVSIIRLNSQNRKTAHSFLRRWS